SAGPEAIRMKPDGIDVFAYTDYRAFLADYYRARKLVDRKFSHRFIKEKMKVGSAGWFSDVLKSRANLTADHIIRLSRLLGMETNEEDYFEALVGYGQAATTQTKNRFFRRMRNCKEVKADLVGEDRIEFYSRWYHSALRELLFFFPFRGDYAALARKLRPEIKVAEVKESIDLLQRMGFLEQDNAGNYLTKGTTLKQDKAFPSELLTRFLKSHIALAGEALDRFDKDQRDISALTISLSDKAFREVREDVRSLRKRVLALTGEDPHPTRVYQCNFQVFPLSD
ncbi:MAG TPA: TIGR02147 family protein, partial [Fibrobacteria bacterium]|nr:TIGR02147 family protein [Fibrobacteria bacterium]